jgi:hypothetical protein
MIDDQWTKFNECLEIADANDKWIMFTKLVSSMNKDDNGNLIPRLIEEFKTIEKTQSDKK